MTGIKEGITKIVAGVEEDNVVLQTVRERARRQAAEETAAEKARIRAENLETDLGLLWLSILKTPVSGGRFVKDLEANKEEIFSWPRPGEQLSAQLFKKIIAEQPGLVSRLVLETAEDRNPAKKKQAATQRDREMRLEFSVICRRNKLSDCDANFQMWKANESLQGLALATAAEVEQFEMEAEEARQTALMNADSTTLRKLVREESAVARQAEAVKEFERQREAEKIRDAGIGFPVLPKSITKFQLKDLGDADFLRRMIRKYGISQINERLNEKD